jgi:hypothetical protein
VTAEQRPDTGEDADDGAESDAQRPRLDKGLLEVSIWWVLLWLLVAVAVLWLTEYLGIFGF